MDLRDLALNLSYVLHAPASSEQVQVFARQAAKTTARAERVVQALARLPDDALARRTLLPARLDDRPAVADGVLALSLGASQLLPCLLGTLAGTTPLPVQLIDAPGGQAVPVTFFRGQAALSVPPGELRRWWFAALVLRPDERTLSLSLEHLALPGPAPASAAVAAAVPFAEAALRAHFLQWAPPSALWTVPAEASLPELRPYSSAASRIR